MRICWEALLIALVAVMAALLEALFSAVTEAVVEAAVVVVTSEAVVPRPCPPMEEFLDGPGGEDGDSDDAEDDGLEESKRMEKLSKGHFSFR